MSSLTDKLGVLAQGAAVVFIGTVLGRALALLGQILIVRELSVELFGHLALAVTVVTAAANVALLGIPEGVTRLIAAEDNSIHRDITQSGAIVVAASGILTALIVYVFRFDIATVMNDGALPQLLVWLLPYLLLFPFAQLTIGTLRGWERSGWAVIVRDLAPRVIALLVFGLLVLTGRPYIGAISYWLALGAVTAVSGFIVVRTLNPIDRNRTVAITRRTLQRLCSFSWPLAIGSSIVLFLSNTDILMIGWLMDPRAVAQYRAVQPLREVTLFVLTSLAFIFYPLATGLYEEGALNELNAFYTTATKWVTSATVPIALTFVLFAPDIVRVLFTARYLPAATALQVLIIGMFLRVIVGPNGVMLKAIDRARVELVASATGLLSNILLNLVLIPRFGIAGAAAATGVGFAVFNFVEVVVIYRDTGCQPFSVDILKPLVVTVVVSLGISRGLGEVTLSLPALLVVGVVLAVVQVLALFFTRSLDREDQQLVEQVESNFGVNLDRLKTAMERGI